MSVDRGRFARELSIAEKYKLTGSPCMKICELKDGVCTGCHRTRNQVVGASIQSGKRRYCKEDKQSLKDQGYPETWPQRNR